MYDPWVTREFTVTDLMAQRSGLPGYSGGDLVTLGYDRGYLRHSLRYTKPETSFRSAYAYQNTLYLTTAELVENLTGKSSGKRTSRRRSSSPWECLTHQ